MKLVKSLLLGSAAGFCAVAGAQAADLPMRRAAPVEYVRVCTAYGAGYFYIPGTDTCMRVGGRARFSYQYMSSRGHGNQLTGASGGLVGRDSSGYQSLAFLNFDARTQTGYGTLRTFIRLIASYNTGPYLASGTAVRLGQQFWGLGQDTFGRATTGIFLDKAFIQFAGFTAGRAGSFFDFYAHDLEHFASTAGSDLSNTNLLAYTMTFGGGWSATLSIEDPTGRRQPIFADRYNDTPVAGGPNYSQLAGFATAGVPYFDAVSGQTRIANVDVAQRNLVPDVVGVIRYDAPWGAAQISAAMHELRPGRVSSTSPVAGGVIGSAQSGIVNAGTIPFSKVKEEIGWAVQGGLKLNLPQLATGDVLWLQAAYSEGAIHYSGRPSCCGAESLSNPFSGRFSVSTVDSFIDTTGKQRLTESWVVTAAFLHYWSPEWRSAVFGSYSEVTFGKGARAGFGPAVLQNLSGTAAGANTIAFNSLLRDYSYSVVGANLIWSPVKDLDIGLEAVYWRADLKGGRVFDGSYANQATQSTGGIPAKTVKYDDVWSVRMRVQRDF